MIAALAFVGAPAQAVSFDDASDRLDGVHHNGLQDGSGYGGVGVLDFDLDGDLDLYFTNGPGQANVLLANDGTGRFTTVVGSGTEVGTGSRAVLVADLDNDRYPDLVLPGDLRAPTRVLHNNTDGTFDDVTAMTGITGSGRANSAHAADVDGDGWLDVYIVGGVTPQTVFANTLYLNNGDGTFTEAAVAAGIGAGGGGCAATFTHFDDDDAIDLVVANCAILGVGDLPFGVFQGAGDGTFVDAFDASRIWGLGHWMGLAFGDFDGNGGLDFFATNSGLERELPHALYANNLDGTWSEVAAASGVADHEFGWGAVAEDFDNDGWVDLYYVGRSQTGNWCASPGNLFVNQGDGTFSSPEVPMDVSESWTSGLASGDFDNDGAVDLVIVRTEVTAQGASGDAILLRNTGSDHHWLTVRPEGSSGWAIGARVRATSGGLVQVREVQAGSSYLSTNSPWPTFGLGDQPTARVCVRWPDGSGEDFGVFDANQPIALVQGTGLGEDPCGPAGPADTGTPGTTGETGGPGPEEEPRGCGCSSGRTAALPFLGLLAVACRTRRRP